MISANHRRKPMFDTDTLTAVRDHFAHVDACPYQGLESF